MERKKMAIFDIDGTLHKTEIISIVAYRTVMQEYNLPEPSTETLFSTYGANTETILKIIGISGSDDYVQGFLKRIEAEENHQVEKIGQCYDGVLESLQRLHHDGIALGVCSMCSPGYMDVFLRRFALEEMIPYRRNESSGTDKRFVLREMLETLQPENVVMVGDRKYDKDAAAYNGIPFVGCTYGYSPSEIKDAAFLANSGTELYDVVRCALSANANH